MNPIPDEVQQLFRAPNIAHIATVLPDGSPHSVPLWVGSHDNHLAVLTSPRSRKALNLEANPHVALSVTDREQPSRMAHVRGRFAHRVDGPDAWTIIDEISHSYIGAPYPLRTDRVIYLIAVEHAAAHAF
ncbi:MAG: class F420-dependent enzyme [Pseudonocardiales bacterium]|nr:class F420-dependent enzyme [Pseudonocardiales bacterium]